MKKRAKRKTASKKGYLFHAKALSIAQPWASVIAFAGKDVENRTWQTHYRGPVAIHASAKLCDEDLECLKRQVRGGSRRTVAEWIKRGQRRYKMHDDEQGVIQSHIVAIAMISDCTEKRSSIWHTSGYWGWVLQGVIPIKPIPMKGTLGLWDCRFRYEPLPLRRAGR